MVDPDGVADWLARYEKAWRTGGTDELAQVFTDDVVYVPSPWARPLVGRAELGEFWDASRDGPDEGFHLVTDTVALEGDVTVVRVSVDYDDGQRWRDLWVIKFADDGRCSHFEEWPFAPDQDDGHQDDRA